MLHYGMLLDVALLSVMRHFTIPPKLALACHPTKFVNKPFSLQTLVLATRGSCGSAVVERSPHHLMVKGSFQAIAAGIIG
jgi:hypothetical protein